MDVADLVVESMTQTEEEIKQALGDEYEPQPPEGEAPPAAPAAAAPAVAEPAKPPEPAAAAPTPAPEKPPAEPAEPGEPKKSSGYKLKFERTQALLRERERELEELRGTAGHTAAGILPKEPEAPVAAAPPAPAAVQPPAVPAAAPAAEAPPVVAAPATFDKPKPKVEDFDYGSSDPAYIDAVSDWNYDRRRFAERQQEETTRTTQAQTERATRNSTDEAAANTRFAQSFTDAKARHAADYDAAMAKEQPKPIWNGVMREAMRRMEHGGELAYWLATHPDEAHEIFQLTVITDPKASESTLQRKYAVAVGELSKIDLGLDAAPAAPEPPAPAAAPAPAAPAAPVAAAEPAKAAPPVKPEPFAPVGSRGHSVTKPVEQLSASELKGLSPDEYRKRRGIAQ